MRAGRAGAVMALTIVAAVAPRPLAAQDLQSLSSDGPFWLRAWSPLLWTADLPRMLPSAEPSLPDPLLWGAPRVGLFWTAGNPGALPLELDDRFSAFRARGTREAGAYRRPLDPARATDAGLSAVGWRSFETRGAAMGRVEATHVGLDGELSDFDTPYPGSPYVVMDTAGSQLGRTDVSLEGASGWRLGALGVGVATAYRAQQTRTTAAPVPRVLSAADPGASVGIVWAGTRRLRLGVQGRWRAHAERVLLYSVAAPSRVYWLQGYFEARPQDVANGYYERRMERDGLALNLEAAGEAAGGTWAAFVERGGQGERQHLPGSNDPNSDTWTSRAWTVGAALARRFGPGARLVLSGRYVTVSGTARRGDLPDTVTFVGDESVLDAAAEVGVTASPTVRLAGRLTVRRERRIRTDQLAQLRSDLESRTVGLGAAASFRASSTLSLAFGAALAGYGAGGTIPDPTGQGVAYRAYVAPELSLEASDTRAWAASLSALWAALRRGSVWARVRRSSLTGARGSVQLPLTPNGDRAAWTVEVGMVLGS